ncbi:MerR family transcriptional regulator [Nonomuraea thailandensis]
MRIGELAALLGVSTRTVRYYHHQGVLPEPPRLANGYREYGMRDAVALARVRRLVELGLSLDEARDVIAEDRSRELPEILAEIDADLAAQEREIHLRRARLAEVLARAEDGTLGPDDTASPDLVAFLRVVDVPASTSAAWDRDLLVLVDSMSAAPDRERTLTMLDALAADPAAAEHGQEFYRRLDELADAEPGDPGWRRWPRAWPTTASNTCCTICGRAPAGTLSSSSRSSKGWPRTGGGRPARDPSHRRPAERPKNAIDLKFAVRFSFMTEGLRERKKRQTRQRISEVAIGLFVERGFDDVTIAEVAAAAEVSVNTVYNYFPAKEDLVLPPEEASPQRLAGIVRERAPASRRRSRCWPGCGRRCAGASARWA